MQNAWSSLIPPSFSEKADPKKGQTSPAKQIQSQETKHEKDNMSWLKFPNLKSFPIPPSTSHIDSSPLKSNPGNENQAPLESNVKSQIPSDTARASNNPSAFSKNVSKGIQDFATTIKKTTIVVAEDFFGTEGTTVNTTNRSKDIFSASVSDVIKDIGKDAMSLIKTNTPSRPKKTDTKPRHSNASQSALSSSEKPIQSSLVEKNVKRSLNNNSLNDFHRKKSVSDVLEIDKDAIDSSQVSTYHIEKDTVMDDKESKSIISPERPPSSYVSPVKAITTTKIAFMQGLTEMPEELLVESSNFNSLQDEDDAEIVFSNSVVKNLEYDGDDCV